MGFDTQQPRICGAIFLVSLDTGYIISWKKKREGMYGLLALLGAFRLRGHFSASSNPCLVVQIAELMSHSCKLSLVGIVMAAI